jgi:hypothetical protein
MTIRTFARPVSRRAALASLGIGSLALATRQLAFAQAATPAAEEVSRIDYPLIGAWQWADGVGEVPGPGFFAPDGTYVEYDRDFGVGVGFWRPTGEDTAELVATFQLLTGSYQNLAGPVEMFEPAYVPQGHAFRGDMVTIRQRLVLDASGTGVTTSGTFQVWVASGDTFENVYSAGFGRKATRLVAETGDNATPAP